MRRDEIPIIYEYTNQKIIIKLEKIKAEIENHKKDVLEMVGDCGFCYGLDKAVEYINIELSELKGEIE